MLRRTTILLAAVILGNSAYAASTDGWIKVDNHVFKENVKSKITTRNWIKVSYGNIGCRGIDGHVRVDVADKHFDHYFQGTVCPGDTEIKFKVEFEDTFKAGTYPMQAQLSWSVVGHSQERGASANLKVES